MPLDSTIICIDNSGYSRNGDYNPHRLQAQIDAANLVAGAKTQQHSENSVGLMTMADLKVLMTPTTEFGKFLTALKHLPVNDKPIDLQRVMAICQLCLKNRQNKVSKQRVLLFVGSPLAITPKEVEAISRRLRKNQVYVDIVSFGEFEPNRETLHQLVGPGNETTNYLEFERNQTRTLGDFLLSTPLCEDPNDMRVETGGSAPGGPAIDGVDPQQDPELYLALKMSLDEEAERKRQADAAAGKTQPPPAAAPAAAPAPEDDEDAELRRALALSLQEDSPPGGAPTPPKEQEIHELVAELGIDQSVFLETDAEMLIDIISTLPGIDLEDPRIKSLIEHVRNRK